MHDLIDLWQRHRAGLRRFVGRRVWNPHDADDIVQDVFLRAQQSLHRLRSADGAPAWLTRIAANRVIDYHRARRPADELPDEIAAPPQEDDPVQALAPCLPGMIDALPAGYRDALLLSEIEGLPQREVAARLGVSLSGAKSRVQRGRALLRRAVQRCCRVLMQGQRIVDFEPIRPSAGCAAGGLDKRLRPS